MVRWHHPTCISPDVAVQAGRPRCRTCSRESPLLPELIAGSKSDGPLSASQTEPPGQLNLWWPHSVSYSQETLQHSATTGSSGISRAQKALVFPDTEPRHQEGPQNLHVYGPTLRANEFRLACISAAGDKDHPVHISLEPFSHDNRPEYEVVSYTWGGEDGDSSLSQAVYIGSYWDVLLQTQNCWEMLRFVRPWRGSRMVWVDAVCINQTDLVERGAQVAKMRQIYADCTRVIVFLGPDLVTSSTTFPAYWPLSRLDETNISRPVFPPSHVLSSQTFGFKDLLQRQYFSRVWVIQELIMAPKAVIRVGDIDFQADKDSVRQIFASDTGPALREWNQTAAPWVRFLGQKQLLPSPEDGASMYRRSGDDGPYADDVSELMRLTANSKSTDPRDRLFAVISLSSDPEVRRLFPPDYSISHQNFYIGTFSHLLLNLHFWWLLGSAPASVTSTLPSWIPNMSVD
ncbi:hypothetical protein GQ53DRAFT_583854, partial [Thozetella sp. PMI_491]